MSGLFSTLNIAKRGMFTQQKAIDVTSHNIANANTEGYSRQRAKIETTRPEGMPSLNSVAEPGQLGTGAQIAAIERVRDSFLDYQVRKETSTQGQYDARAKSLSEVESVFNEPTDTGISTLMSKFFSSWQDLVDQSETSNARTVVVQQSLALTDELNHTYDQLQKLKVNAQDSIKQNVVDINSMLDQINQLNQQIVQVKVAGNEPNDLMDKRDLLLDQLSSKFNIKIDKQNFEGIDLKAEDATGYDLVNAIITGNEKRLDTSYDANGNIQVIFVNSDGTTAGAFQPTDGELKGYLSIQSDIDSYTADLNKLAKAIAFSVNAVNSGTGNAGSDSLPFFVNSSTNTSTAGESSITAGNITVNQDIIDNVMLINTGTSTTSTDNGESDGARALAIAQLKDVLLNFDNINSTSSRADLITDTPLKANGLGIQSDTSGAKMDNYFKDIINKLGVQSQEASRISTNQETLLNSFEESRLSVSGVSLDEEMANLIQFQHAYSANAKMISTVDELLDVVVNGLKK